MAQAGSALGVDISVPAIERARELAGAQGVRNVTFEQADAQVHRFPRERFDLAISRFGTMFFAEPVAAFTNIGRALRPAGRLVMMVWQAHDRNEWDMAIRRSRSGPEGSAAVVLLRIYRPALDAEVIEMVVEELEAEIIRRVGQTFGLAQLYQLRGRVGRSNRRAPVGRGRRILRCRPARLRRSRLRARRAGPLPRPPSSASARR